MKKELQDKLYNKYPSLFKDKDKSMQETCMCWGIDCGEGWFSLIDKMCEEIMKVDKKKEIRFIQVKEKFASLRCYTNIYVKEVEEIIDRYVVESYKTCEHCGAKENVHTNQDGWMSTLCNECRDKLLNRK